MDKHMQRLFLLCLMVLVLSGCPGSPAERQQALLVAAEQGDIPRMQGLLADETNVDARDACLFTPLMKVASSGNLEAVELLLLAGAEVDAADKGGYTALLLAASNNHTQVVERLLLAGADINHQEETQGWSPLIWAANLGHVQTVEILLAHGADTTLQDAQGRTALDWARMNQHDAIEQYLLSADVA